MRAICSVPGQAQRILRLYRETLTTSHAAEVDDSTGHNSWWSRRMWVSEAMCGRQLWPWAVSSLSGANVATTLINMRRRFMAHPQMRKQRIKGLRSLLGFSWSQGSWAALGERPNKSTFMFTSVVPLACVAAGGGGVTKTSRPDLSTTKQRKSQGSGEPHQGLTPVTRDSDGVAVLDYRVRRRPCKCNRSPHCASGPK